MTQPLPFINRNSPVPLFGLSVSYPSLGALERIGPDWDWIWLDAQHGDMDFRETADLVRVTDLIRRPALVRVPAHDPAWIGKILDIGAAGVIVPVVETVAQAKAMVAAAKFPPLGIRSYGGRRVIDRMGRGYYKTANRDTLLILQLESVPAVALADQMAAIDGVDGLFLGPDDLMISSGIDVDTPKNRETIGQHCQSIGACCRKHGKLVVGLGVSDAAMALAKEEKFNLVVGAGDVGFLATGSATAAQKLRNYFKNNPAAAGGAAGSASLY